MSGMKNHTTKAGGKMAPPFLAKGESKTAKPAKQKVLAKKSEQSERMMDRMRKNKM